jgi:hypothetical protein
VVAVVSLRQAGKVYEREAEIEKDGVPRYRVECINHPCLALNTVEDNTLWQDIHMKRHWPLIFSLLSSQIKSTPSSYDN